MTNYLFRGEGRCSGETAPKWSKTVVKKSRKNPKRKGDISQFCSSSFRREEVWNPFFSDNCPLKSTVPFTIAYPRCFSYPTKIFIWAFFLCGRKAFLLLFFRWGRKVDQGEEFLPLYSPFQLYFMLNWFFKLSSSLECLEFFKTT